MIGRTSCHSSNYQGKGAPAFHFEPQNQAFKFEELTLRPFSNPEICCTYIDNQKGFRNTYGARIVIETGI